MVLEPFGRHDAKRSTQATIRQLVRVAQTWTVQETVRLKMPPECQLTSKVGHWQSAVFSGEGIIS